MIRIARLICAILFVGLVAEEIQAQTPGIAAYSDNLNRFYVFYNGNTRQIEHLPIQNYKIGGNCLAYNDNTGNFKVFYKNKLEKLQDGFVNEDMYWPTDNLLVYRMGQQLKVFDRGTTLTLSGATDNVAIGDSIVVWYDKMANALRIYYDRQRIDVVDGLLNATITNFKAGANIVAFIDNNRYFRVWYKGEDIELISGVSNVNYDAGRNVVAYWNAAYNSFNLFYKGEDILIDEYEPESFKAGDDMLAYVDNVGEFKCYYDGQIYDVSAYAPDWYGPDDNLLIYSEQGAFKCFYKGQKYFIENYVPEDFQVNNNSIAYLDQQGRLKAFIAGETVTVSKEIVQAYMISRNTIQYMLGNRTNKVYWENNTY